MFPDTPLGMRAELHLGESLGWVDVTGDVYKRDPVTITRGRQRSAQSIDPGSCTLTLNNAGGKYSPRNPRSPYFGLLGRNTPLRVSVQGTEGYLEVPEGEGTASTPASPAITPTGDLDVRVEATGDWYGWRARGRSQTLIGQYDIPNSSSAYVLFIDIYGNLRLNWSTDGADFAFVSALLPGHVPERAAFRATLDVDNGTGGSTATVYWAESLDGPWSAVASFTTSTLRPIYTGSTAPLQLPVSEGFGEGLNGRVHRAELRDGIDGPLLASPDFRPLAEGTTSFTDSAGVPWTVSGDAYISDRAYRFHGEVSEWPPRWDTSGHDVWVPVQAAGVLRRMGQGAAPLQSTLRRRIPGGGPEGQVPRAYWPMEEGRYATQAYSPLPGVEPLRTSGLQWAADDTLFGSDALPTVGQSASISGRPGAGTGQDGGWHVDMAYRLDELPSSPETMMRVHLAGAQMTMAEVTVSTAGIKVAQYDGEDNTLASFTFSDPDALAAFVGEWTRLQFFSATAGGDTYAIAYWRNVVTGHRWWAASAYPGGVGILTRISADWGQGLSGMAVGHIGIWGEGGTTNLDASEVDSGITYFDDADDGYEGEHAFDRVLRVAGEEGIRVFLHDGPGSTERVGPQRVQSALELLGEAAEADGGLLYEHRRTPNLAVRFRSSLYNQAPALTLDYAGGDVAPPLEPTEDDQGLANDVTVRREGGSSARVVLASGPLSVQPPPDGVGVYDSSVTLNLADDSQAEPMAQWLLHLGTVDEARYPTVHVRLHGSPHLIPQVLDTDVLDRVQILNPPEWLPPGTIELLAEGYTEILGVYTWDIEFNCSPGSPWLVGTVAAGDGTDGTSEPNRLDTDGSVLAVDAAEADTELLVSSSPGPVWTTDCAETPFDAEVGGETIRVEDIADGVIDTFTRTVAGGWGSTESGQAWTTTGPAASDFSVSSGTGHVSVGSTNVSRFCLLPPVGGTFDVTVSVETDALAVGGGHYPQLIARRQDDNNYYAARLDFGTDQSVTLTIRRRLAGSESALASYLLPGATHAAGKQFTVRFHGDGDTLRARAWLASDAEPDVWHLTATDSALAGGQLGIRSILSSVNTNPLPVTFTYDDFTVYNPQRFTVTRAVNGITKQHGAGTDVRLAQPAIVAL